MGFKCLVPRVAIQDIEGAKPRFLKHSDYEFYLRVYNPSKILLIPCGKCPNCLARKAEEWTIRLLKESENYLFAYFITLTYNDEHLKELNKRDIQLFLKRYRKWLGVDLKYYICGEHGETTGRPHYHAVFFQDKAIPDLRFFKSKYFVSKSFESCWKFGQCLISSEVNKKNIKYTIAYTLKKLGEEKVVLMSKGIGLDFFKSNKEKIKEFDGFYVLNGRKERPNTYFKRKLKESEDINDVLYLKAKDEEFKPSKLLSGFTLQSLFSSFLEQRKKIEFKGKGEF